MDVNSHPPLQVFLSLLLRPRSRLLGRGIGVVTVLTGPCLIIVPSTRAMLSHGEELDTKIGLWLKQMLPPW